MTEYDVKRYGYTMPVPRRLLLDAGLIEPTPDERAAMDRAATESRKRELERTEVLAAARVRLAAIMDPVARAVLDLHAENERGECAGDDMEGYEAESPEWPCRSVETVAAHYGIKLRP